MSERKTFYITTTLPYVNAEPHLGHALEFIRADVIARYKKSEGFDVFFNTGTDEHGAKLFEAAKKEGVEVKAYVDKNAENFRKLYPLLGISEDLHHIRTTDPVHIKAAQEMWRLCNENGFIDKKLYKTKYCVGCELEKTDSELDENGRCPIHPNMEIQVIEEENYFFKFSEFSQKLLEYYEKNPEFVVPNFRFNEIKSFVKAGLEDFSISRLKEKMSWGVPVPGDEKHVMYVWFDALTSYISSLGWPDNKEQFEKYWKNGAPIQYCGKDNLRQQSAMWQAMLMAAGLPNSNKIIIDGFVTGDGGIKMSKSLGNVVSPIELVEEYGTDALRYFVLRELSPFEDSPFTKERFKDAYNANLANGLGNLVSRVMKMATANNVKVRSESMPKDPMVKKGLESFDLKSSMDVIWSMVSYIDGYIQKEEPFKKIKNNEEEAKKDIENLLKWLRALAIELSPFLPETSKIIVECVEKNEMPEKPLFPRKD